MSLPVTLFSALLKREIIKLNDTEVQATVSVPGIGGNTTTASDLFVIVSVTGKRVVLSRISDHLEVNAKLEDISRIDGMLPETLAEAFGLSPEGNPLIIYVDGDTDVKRDILGQKEYTLPTGESLSNGMMICLESDASDELNDVVLTVRGVGSSIELKKPRGRPKIHF
jgi:hypothetical protein